MKGACLNLRMTLKRHACDKARAERKLRAEAWRLGITPELLRRLLDYQRQPRA